MGAGAARWDAVLFDLDGTLADTMGVILECYRHAVRAHLGEERADAEWLASMGAPLREQMREFARSDAEADAMVATYVARLDAIHDARVRAFAGAAEAVAALARGGTALGIVTGKRRGIALRTLRCCGLDACFAAVVTADDASPGKPDPAPILAALERLGSPRPERTLYVGDAPFDILAGRAAGVRTAAALWGAVDPEALLAAGPDYVLEDVGALAALQGLA